MFKQIDNGYILVFAPEHHRALGGGYKGWVYEHILVAEKKLKRKLKVNEEVHHLDLRRSNNSPRNLLVCSGEQHQQIHAWLNRGTPVLGKKLSEGITLKSSTKFVKIKRCESCEFPLFPHMSKFCSISCSHNQEGIERPSKEKLLSLLEKNTWVRVAKMFNVSDTAVRKWVKNYGLDPNSIK